VNKRGVGANNLSLEESVIEIRIGVKKKMCGRP
jgi:hypothetical protein